jgi:hypothetical protein
MANDARRRLPLLIGLLAVLGTVTWWQFGGGASPPRPTSAATRRPPARPGRGAATPVDVLVRGVGLERLAEDRPAPEEHGRDPFRTGSAPPPEGGSSGPAAPVTPTTSVPATPTGPIVSLVPPGPPPIAVKFIGLVKRQDIGKVAVLSDGKNVYYGREGEIVDGRWRIVTIGEESLQIEYADGRGRLTVRLTG